MTVSGRLISVNLKHDRQFLVLRVVLVMIMPIGSLASSSKLLVSLVKVSGTNNCEAVTPPCSVRRTMIGSSVVTDLPRLTKDASIVVRTTVFIRT